MVAMAHTFPPKEFSTRQWLIPGRYFGWGVLYHRSQRVVINGRHRVVDRWVLGDRDSVVVANRFDGDVKITYQEIPQEFVDETLRAEAAKR
jgi:hypothetical protein